MASLIMVFILVKFKIPITRYQVSACRPPEFTGKLRRQEGADSLARLLKGWFRRLDLEPLSQVTQCLPLIIGGEQVLTSPLVRSSLAFSSTQVSGVCQPANKNKPTFFTDRRRETKMIKANYHCESLRWNNVVIKDYFVESRLCR